MQTARTWLDNWCGVGDVVTRMNRQGYMLDLSNVDAFSWPATFDRAPLLSADGFGAGATPWRAVQLAALGGAHEAGRDAARAGGGHHLAVNA